MKIENINYTQSSFIDDEHPSVIDTLPNTLSWSYKDDTYIVKNKYKIIATLIEDNTLIAIIEDPFNIIENKAYIVNGAGKCIMNVKNLFEEKYGLLPKNNSVVFIDLYFIDKILYFFLNFNGCDFRLSIDVHKNTIGVLIESR